MKRRTVLSSALALICTAAMTLPAAALDRQVRIVNETNYTIMQFYGSNKGTDSWEEDILGNDVLRPGQSVRIDFDDGTGYCKFDFKAVFDDGDVLVSNDINICKIGTYTYN